MKKQKITIKLIVLFLVTLFSFSVSAQDETREDLDIEGSYTIYIKSVKNSNIQFTEQQKLEIENNRLDNKYRIIQIDGFSVRIMSRNDMESDMKWPKYSLTND